MTAAELAREVVKALQKSAKSKPAEVRGAGWTWTQLVHADENVPITIDLVASDDTPATHVVYMLPGSSMNFRASFFQPQDDNLAHYLRGQGALIVGVSPRDDNLPAEGRDDAALAQWGFAKRRQDLRAIVELVQPVADLPYDVMGHSFGAAIALDYAANFPDDVRRVLALEMGFGSERDRPNAERTYQAYLQLLEGGTYLDDSTAVTRPLLAAAIDAPTGDSGVPRSESLPGLRGNFTNAALLHLGLIYSASLPNAQTAITGLTGDWLCKQGTLAGEYLPAPDPQRDTFRLTKTTLENLKGTFDSLGSGLTPLAQYRDWWAVAADNPGYAIAWDKIRAQVTWVNVSGCYDDAGFAPQRIRAGGNMNVTTAVIPDYAHLDVVLAQGAKRDIWPVLAPE